MKKSGIFTIQTPFQNTQNNGSVKNVGVVVTLIYFRALFFLKNDWF